MRKKLLFKFMLPAVAVAVVATQFLGFITAQILESEVRKRAESKVLSETERVLDDLNTVDSLSSQNIEASMRVLRREADSLGSPEIKGSAASIAGESVPDLHLGGTSVVGNFTLVDRIKELTGNTATIFVRRGDDFVRVSTNVLKPDGSRAVATVLDRKGAAIAAIRREQPFNGVVDILGKPYMTGYAPLRNATGETIGVWYVGAPIGTLATLGQHISTAKVLDHGFIALLKSDGKVIFKSDWVQDSDVQQRLQAGTGGGWNVISKPFEKWGYNLVVAYPESDITAEIIKMKLVIAAFSVLMSVFLVALLYWLVTRLILRPVEELVRVSREIASGDLSNEVKIASEDEIGELARSFSSMVTYLREMASISEAIAEGNLGKEVVPRCERDILGHAFVRMSHGLGSLVRSVRDSASQVEGASGMIAHASDESARVSKQGSGAIDEVTSTMHQMNVNVQTMVKNTQAQASGVNETSAAIEEMITSIQRVADTAHVLVDISNRSREEVYSGIDCMEKATGGLNRINHSIHDSAAILDMLGSRAESIGQIVEVIDDIAEQTNLLALNAAIESARAGEAGLGFAVVADEVRKLAEKSAQATKEISDVIRGMQKEARSAIENMSQSTATVQEGITLNGDLSTALKKISNVVTEVHKMAQEIGMATQEQSGASGQISAATSRLNEVMLHINSSIQEQATGTQIVENAMVRMRDLLQQSTASSGDLAASAELMSRMAGELMKDMDRFQLEPQRELPPPEPRRALCAAGAGGFGR